jgi:hypothetical protein
LLRALLEELEARERGGRCCARRGESPRSRDADALKTLEDSPSRVL